jgi:DNA-binding winged helix-turn-helix (wHTH) protein
MQRPVGRLDLERRVLVDPADGSEETLTASEYDLLKVFADNPNRPLQRDWLLEVTAHREMEAFDRAIDPRVTRLRRKIEPDPMHPDVIRTVRGVGYMFVARASRKRAATHDGHPIRIAADVRSGKADYATRSMCKKVRIQPDAWRPTRIRAVRICFVVMLCPGPSRPENRNSQGFFADGP